MPDSPDPYANCSLSLAAALAKLDEARYRLVADGTT